MFLLIIISLQLCCAFGNLEGPFLFWGPENLAEFRKPALKNLGQDELMKIYANRGAIVVFNNQDSAPLIGENFPRLRKSLEGKTFLVLPQGFLEVHPDYVSNETQMFTLQGPSSERDAEITETFNRLEVIYGQGNVLAILGNSASHDYNERAYVRDEFDYIDKGFRKRREVEQEEDDEKENKEDKKLNEKESNDFALYRASTSSVQALLYSSSWPVLQLNETGEVITLQNSVSISVNKASKQAYQFVVAYKSLYNNSNVTIRLKFRFDKMQASYWWAMGGVEVEIIKIATEATLFQPPPHPPSAQIGKSYHCSTPLVFTGSKGTLTLKDIQFEPFMESTERFSDSYDCVGFFTVPIWSGIGVTFVMAIGLAISLIMIMDIKTMDKFDSNKGKMLTITVNE